MRREGQSLPGRGHVLLPDPKRFGPFLEGTYLANLSIFMKAWFLIERCTAVSPLGLEPRTHGLKGRCFVGLLYTIARTLCLRRPRYVPSSFRFARPRNNVILPW